MSIGSNESINPNIACTVETCTYHSGSSKHCTLNGITIDCSQHTPHSTDGTMCASFENKA